jgi:hypothetical protein
VGACATAPPEQGRVYLLGTLYARHRTTPGYDVGRLRRIMEAVDPGVLVLDVTPEELQARRVHASKVEYVEAVFPFMRERPTYAAEPARPLFDEIVGEISAAFGALPPEVAAGLDEHESALFGLLQRHWTSAAAAHDGFTAQMMGAKVALTGDVIPAYARGQARWDEHSAARTAEAAGAHPDARVLALTSIENWPRVRRLVQDRGVACIDMESWLNDRGL